MKTELTEKSKLEEYAKLLMQIKKEYKPRLKNQSKGTLIDIIVELSAQVAYYKQEFDMSNSKENKND